MGVVASSFTSVEFLLFAAVAVSTVVVPVVLVRRARCRGATVAGVDELVARSQQRHRDGGAAGGHRHRPHREGHQWILTPRRRASPAGSGPVAGFVVASGLSPAIAALSLRCLLWTTLDSTGRGIGNSPAFAVGKPASAERRTRRSRIVLSGHGAPDGSRYRSSAKTSPP
jgi:hypothetical protein